MACALGDDEVVGLLLNAGADKDAADDDGTTGLIAGHRGQVISWRFACCSRAVLMWIWQKTTGSQV